MRWFKENISVGLDQLRGLDNEPTSNVRAKQRSASVRHHHRLWKFLGRRRIRSMPGCAASVARPPALLRSDLDAAGDVRLVVIGQAQVDFPGGFAVLGRAELQSHRVVG
jgi:hypothetical protein